MVSSGSALSACIMLLLGSFAFARDMDENTGYVTKVLHNNENGGIDIWRAPAATLTTAAAAAVDRRNPMPSSASSSSACKFAAALYSAFGESGFVSRQLLTGRRFGM